ncbi:uncharacterized protein [Blastocystis hominis]|uniref:AAA+ ATPase domain-containing protein n=1 Tax=Blastocystis hominis TaxID=12968 RepID=D8M420_BLAHO|nr:uncharacterized protein [Blastocystis hominis]CBK22809.2 unnamed protein product [Blastocystis hominis]|eukprot:XP_012896857.1 uncharacterized protein [Blastocystis hominis]
MAIRSDREDWKYIESKAYRYVKTIKEDPPFIRETNQTKIRNQIVEDVIQYNIPVVIEGVTSSGKTFTVEQYCRRSLVPFVRYNFSPSSTTEELLGDMVITNDDTEKIKFQDGAFTDAFIHGKLLLMDEMSLAPPSVVQSVLSYLFGKKILHEGKDGSEERVMHRDFRIIATQNPAGSSYKRNNLSSAIRDCFRFITHDSTRPKYFPMIGKEERLDIITAMFGKDTKIGRRVCEIHDRADNRKNVSGKEIDKGKDYTLRDCSRAKWMMETLMDKEKIGESNALDRALQIAYNEDLKTNPVFKADITFSEAALDKECWKDVYDRVRLGLESGCHVLLIGETEYVSRKYCRAIMEIMQSEGTSCEVIHCSSTSSTESVIGSYSLEKDTEGKPVPRFCPSPLLKAIENGGICVLQSMHLMKSNVIERLNSVLELSPADGHHHVVRFDERRERPEFEMSPEFRVIATTSEKGLLAFSPALRNRFLEVFVSHEDAKRFENSPKLGKFTRDDIGDLIHDYSQTIDWFQQKELHRMACFAREVCEYKLDEYLIEMLARQPPIPELQSLRSHWTEASRLFYCICRNKAVALCGPRGSGKSYAIREIINKLYIRNYQVFSVSGETEFSTLMGSMDMNGDFRAGRLLQAVESGGLVIFENAENMSAELLEMLDTVCDPFTDEFTYPASLNHSIHPSFRALFVFTTRRVNSLPSLPAYFDICEMSPIQSDEAKELMNSEICKRLCDHIDSNEIPLNEVFTLDKICFNTSHPIWIVAALFADRMDRKELLERVIEEWKKTADAEMKQELEMASVVLSTPTVTAIILPANESSSLLQRGPLETTVPIEYSKLKDLDSSVLTALFTLSISNFKQTHLPVLLVGDSDIASEITHLLFPSAAHMEMSRSMEMSHTFGEISVCRKEDIQYILRQTSIQNVDGTPMETYQEYLKRLLYGMVDNESLLMMRPGPILRSIMSNNSIVLNNINLLNDRLLPRLYSLLFSLDSQEFSLFEDYSQIQTEILGKSVNAIVTCEDPDYGRVAKKDQFIQVFCQPYSGLERAKYEFENRDDYPLHILRKSDMLRNEFVNAEKVIPFYFRFLQSDLASRENLIQIGMMNEDLEEVSEFLQSSNKDDAMIEDLKQTLSFLFTNDVIDDMESSLQSKHPLLPTKTTIQLLASIVLANRSHLPLILEGDPGVGKTVSAENYFVKESLVYKRINFSNTITIDSLFGCYTIVNGSLQFRDGSITELLKRGDHSDQRIALLLDEVNLAPSDVLEVLLTLIRCYVNHDPFQVPGGDLINIPSNMLIICCMNPASMSANRSTLPRQFYKYCIYHRDLKFTLNELFVTARQILSNVMESEEESTENQILDLFEYSYNSYQKTSIPFSLRDVLKVDQIVNNGNNLSLETALWLVFACRYEESERKEIEKILKLEDRLRVDIIKQDDQCVVRGYWDIETRQMYSGSFKEYCFTSTEKVTIFKLSLALQSKRAILVYGSSPSGKSYCISNLALMWDKRCTSVFLNHESSPDVFIGRSTLGIDENGNECIKFREGPLLKAMESGDWIVIEDIHLANNDVMESLNSLCEENPTLKVLAGNEEITYSMQPKEGERKIDEAFRIFFTISDNTLKHFTGPFLSRCVIVYCDPISTQANVQEICQTSVSTQKPCNFGSKESKTFRRCIRVINSKERDAFLYEFGYYPKSNRVVSNIYIPKSIDFELFEFLDNVKSLSETDRMTRMIAIMEKICTSTKSAFVIEDTIELLQSCVKYFEYHFIYYVMDCAIKVLDMKDLQNCIIAKQRGENAGVLRRWYLISSIDPKMKGKYRMSDWMFNQELTLKQLFDIPSKKQKIYLELLFICDRRDELYRFMGETVLNDLVLEVFSLLNTSSRSDLTEDMLKEIINIRDIFLDVKKRERHLREKAKAVDCISLRNEIKSVKISIESFPSEIKESDNAKDIIYTLESIESSAKMNVINYGGIEDDDEQGMKFKYSEAEYYCGKDEELRNYLKQAFEDGMIDSKTYKSMNFNVNESKYTKYEYKSRANEYIVKTSHLIYKLKSFENYPTILSEYADVLNRLELNVADILKEFSSSSILLPYLLKMLNVLLKKEMENLDWERLLEDYSEYPFITPVEVTQGDFEAAIKALFEKDWYKSYWNKVKDKAKDRSEAYSSLKEELVNKCYSAYSTIEIKLKVPLLLDAVDNCIESELKGYDYLEVSQVDVWWKCDLPTLIEPGTTIPSETLKMERSLLIPYDPDYPLLELMWGDNCPLTIEDKLAIICPRKRTMEGKVVLDILEKPFLNKALTQIIMEVTNIDELVSRVIDTAEENSKKELAKMKQELEDLETKKSAMDKIYEEKQTEAKQMRQQLIDKYTRLASEKTKMNGNKKEYERRNGNTIKMLGYMHAVNNLSEDDYSKFLVQAPQEKYDLKYKPCYEYHPFDFQMIFVPKKHKVLTCNQQLSVIISAPDGLSEYLQSSTILIKGDKITSFGIHIPDGYLLVLPLAPFKWNVSIKINAKKTELKKREISLVYYTNEQGKLVNSSYDNSAESNARIYFLLCLLKCMVFIRDYFNLKYANLLSQEKLYAYNKNHYSISGKYHSSSFYFNNNKPYNCSLFKNTIICNCNFKVDCNEINSFNDVLPQNQISLELTKSSWSLDDYLYIGNDFGSVESVAVESRDDVSNFKNLVEKCNEYEKELDYLRDDIQEKRKEYEKEQKEMESIRFMFFPSKSEMDSTIQSEVTLSDSIITIYENSKASICLPENKTYYLPVSYVEENGNEISIPYYSTSSEIKLVVRSNDCDISESSNRFVFVMKDNDIGQKRVSLIATVYRMSDNEKLATEEFYLCYERKSLPNRIVTSAPCYLHTAANSNSNNILYPTILPINIVVYRNGKCKQYTATNSKWITISSMPCVDVSCSEMKKSSYPLGTHFIWNENEIKVLKNEEIRINQIQIDHKGHFNAQSVIQNLQSSIFSTFYDSLLSLPIALLYANEKEKQMMISILNGCRISIILPSIKIEAERIMNMVISHHSILSWSSLNKKKQQSKQKQSKRYKGNSKTVELYEEMKDDEIKNNSQALKRPARYHKLDRVVIDDIHRQVQLIKQMENLEDSSAISEKNKPQNNMNKTEIREYKSSNYKEYLETMKSLKMDDLFESIYQRRTILKYVIPFSNNETLKHEEMKPIRNLIDVSVIEAVVSQSTGVIALLKQQKCMNRKPHSTINIIIDTNCSLRKNKLRMRTIISCILVIVMKELGISFNLYVFCGRYKGAFVSMDNRSIREIISFLFDIEEVVKMPSTPLDLLTVSGHFNEKDPVVIVSDGFSEQLMSQNDEVRTVFKRYRKLFLLCVKGNNNETLSALNQSLLERSLRANFNKNMIIIIERINDIYNNGIKIIEDILFDSGKIKMNAVADACQSTKWADVFTDDLRMAFEVNQSLVAINTLSSIKPVRMVDLSEDQLLTNPKKNPNSTVINAISKFIQGENLFDAMNTSLFIPNKSAAFVASTSGTSIHMANYIKYVASKTGDGKFFKKLGGEKIRSYNASIVIDCSSIAFSETNRVHSLYTIFTILRNLSNMQLPCIDLWVASSQIIRIATGILSMDLWESNIVAALYEYLLSPCQNTCLPDCIRYACCTCNARSYPSIMMVLTNGVLCNESREEIISIVSGIEMTYLGIGLGLYLCGFEDLFPTMIWNSNPNQLSETMMNLTIASINGNQNAVPAKKIDEMILSKTFKRSHKDLLSRICDILSMHEMTLSNVRFVDKTDGIHAMKKIGDITNSIYDLGIDGAFKDYSILFIILYLCRGIKDENGLVIDEYITEDVLINGKVINGKRFSPAIKLGDKVVNGIPIGKGFEIHYAFDYKTAIRELMSGKYRMTYITCSPGDGIMAKKSDDDVDQYADAFVSCVYEFNKRGGGVFWFLENYPFTYEADLYFEKFYGFEAVGDKDKNIQGGNVMERVISETPKSGQFITIGGKATNFENITRLDLGIVSIFEGRTLCTLNEKSFVDNGFRIFARESEGNATILVREKQEGSKEGRMIIDTAASKLFLEFTEEGTARWISNAAVWLCNTEEFEEERAKNTSLTTGIKMDGVMLPDRKNMEKRQEPYEIQQFKLNQVNFCISIVMDTTGSMEEYINATRDNIVLILDKIKQVENEYNIIDGGIVGQVVQYKDYRDVYTGEKEEYITNDFEKLKSKLSTFDADGGSSGARKFCWCEDIQGGLIRALKQIKLSEYLEYYHLILIVGDYPNHLDLTDCGVALTDEVEQIKDKWNTIYEEIRSIPKIRIMFMPVSCGEIVNTMKRMQSELGSEIVDSAEVTTETNFIEVVTQTAITEYKRFIGIS